MSVKTRSRSDKNVVDARLDRTSPSHALHDFVPTFLYGLHRHIVPLSAECGKVALPCAGQSCVAVKQGIIALRNRQLQD